MKGRKEEGNGRRKGREREEGRKEDRRIARALDGKLNPKTI